jgi:rhamnulokinase
MSTHTFLAFDFGASSGRGILVTLADGRVSMEELHRFENFKVQIGDTLHWNVLWLQQQIVECLRLCAKRDVQLTAIGVDAWGVDFGLLDADGTLLGNPVCYRDLRTENIHEYTDRIVSQDDIFAQTACDPWPISTLMQLLAMKRDGSAQLTCAKHLLHIPDLFNYFLTGIMTHDLSNLTTGNMVDPDCQWAANLFHQFGLPGTLVEGDIIAPPVVLGALSESIQKETGLGPVPVVCVAGHDTASVVAAIPAQGDNWAFISCGTWSILGAARDEPVTDPACLHAGFTNEYTIGGWYLCHNISGLWLINELQRHWSRQDASWDFVRMTNEARDAEAGGLIDVSDASLTAPENMEQALLAVLAKNNQPAPESLGQLVRSVLESLALEYAKRLKVLGTLAGEQYEKVYMVGGGIANTLLCELTANACGLPIDAGANECTAMGNALGQGLAVGAVESLADLRKIMRASVDIKTYMPSDADHWQARLAAYVEMTK